MAKNGYRIFDSDMHIMEPPDLWEKYIDPEFKSMAPKGLTSNNVRDLRVQPRWSEWTPSGGLPCASSLSSPAATYAPSTTGNRRWIG